MIVSDGDLAKNVFNPTTGEIRELGFNKYENFVFQGNQALLFNAVEYMLDQQGIIEARAKEVKLRMLDVVRAQSESLYWQFISFSIASPLSRMRNRVGIIPSLANSSATALICFIVPSCGSVN